jgi:hypothetical protein
MQKSKIYQRSNRRSGRPGPSVADVLSWNPTTRVSNGTSRGRCSNPPVVAYRSRGGSSVSALSSRSGYHQDFYSARDLSFVIIRQPRGPSGRGFRTRPVPRIPIVAPVIPPIPQVQECIRCKDLQERCNQLERSLNNYYKHCSFNNHNNNTVIHRRNSI